MLGPVSGDFLQPLLGPFNHTVALQVVGRGGVVVGADDVAGAGPQRGGELGSLVGDQVGRQDEAGHPLADEGVPIVVVQVWTLQYQPTSYRY